MILSWWGFALALLLFLFFRWNPKVSSEAYLFLFFQTTKAFLPTMLEINHGHIVTVASSLGLFSTAGVEVCHYKAFPSFSEFTSSQIHYSPRSVPAALIFLQAPGSYLCAVVECTPAPTNSIFCINLTLVWQTNGSSRSRWASHEYGPILISSFTWRQWEDTGSRWNWRALAVPQRTDKWG